MKSTNPDDSKEEHKLTPHTIRLIRLITSSSSSSSTKRSASSTHDDKNDHTKYAIQLLAKIASKSHPLILWDILARLYISLTDPEENDRKGNSNSDADYDSISRRENIALAMEHVAKFIPSSDRRHFLMDDTIETILADKCENGTVKGKDESTNSLQDNQKKLTTTHNWLSVQDFLPQSANDDKGDYSNGKWKNLDMVLQKGRLLLSSSGAQYDTCKTQSATSMSSYEYETSSIDALDSEKMGLLVSRKDVEEFLNERIKLQRSILANRLGLGGILSSSIVQGGTEKSDELITDEDLLSGDMYGPKGQIHQNESEQSHRRNEARTQIEQKDQHCEIDQTKQMSARERNIKRLKKKRTQFQCNDDENSKKPRRTKSIKQEEDNEKEKEQDDDDENENEKKSPVIRNLLLLSINYQTRNASSSTTHYHHRFQSSCISHRSPQTLLATDLIYNSFHPFWHVRHGSLLGLLALLRSWHSSTITTRKTSNCHTSDNNNQWNFGKWPQDILARCICILALDRFGDYSGPTIQSFNCNQYWLNSERNEQNMDIDLFIQGTAMMAPVRDVAARVLALLFSMSSNLENVHGPGHQVLLRLSSYMKEWEVRHGAMLAFKYITAFICGQDIHRDQLQILNNIWNDIPTYAIKGLKDNSDDVRGASAQALSHFVQESGHGSNENNYARGENTKKIIRNCTETLWKAMKEVNNTSSCVLDLITLFSRVISADCHLALESIGVFNISKSRHVMEEILFKMNEFLNFDSISVQLSCFNALAIIAEPIAMTLRNSEKRNDNNGNSVILGLYCKLLSNLFSSFCSGNHFLVEDDEENYDMKSGAPNEYSEVEFFQKARNKAWQAIISSMRHCYKYDDLVLMHETFLDLVFRLLNITATDSNLKSQVGTKYHCLLVASCAFSDLCHKIHVGPFLEISLPILFFSLLESPWPDLCESICIFLKNLILTQSHDENFPYRSEYHRILLQTLTDSPKCILLESYHNISSVRMDESVKDLCSRTLVSVLKNQVKANNCNFQEKDLQWIHGQVNQVSQVWANIFHAFDIDLISIINAAPMIEKSKSYMRISASIAGAILSFGLKLLPLKLTPLIRVLMTSVKNEEVSSRSNVVCDDLSHLIQILIQSNRSHLLVRNKILDNICQMASTDPTFDNLARGTTRCGCRASKTILQHVVASIPKHEGLTKINSVWSYLATLTTSDPAKQNSEDLKKAISLLSCVSSCLTKNSQAYEEVVSLFLPNLALIACAHSEALLRQQSVSTITNICILDSDLSVPLVLPTLFKYLNMVDDDAVRLGATIVMNTLVDTLGVNMRGFVRYLIPISMSMMVDPLERCSKLSALTFAHLVRLAPIVCVSNEDKHANNVSIQKNISDWNGSEESFQKVVDHLIHGKPLPSCVLPKQVISSLSHNHIALRSYQVEGISWLQLLRSLKLNGALCDEMGLGKTIQALVAVMMVHEDMKKINHSQGNVSSLIVCPSSVVSHWMNEIVNVDPTQELLRPLQYIGHKRKEGWKTNFKYSNIVITSYSVLRADIDSLLKIPWAYCVLDEGHLIKNPKTATAKAARCLRSKHKLILTGTPVQNRVQELWAAFDWLMPNYLGSAIDFTVRFGKPILKGSLPGASLRNMRLGKNRLKMLHQQVLPFILRREKGNVLEQLPPKIITDVPCSLTEEQELIYKKLSANQDTQNALQRMQSYIQGMTDNPYENEKHFDMNPINKEVLRSLMLLRMLCTHPLLLKNRTDLKVAHVETQSLGHFNISGKLRVLNDLLRTAGIFRDEMTAADNDKSMIYVSGQGDETEYHDHYSNVIEGENGMLDEMSDEETPETNNSKCLIFAQFCDSLSIVEELIFKPLMPTLRYVRLDGRVNLKDREKYIKQFMEDENVKCMLLTTKVGSLGLNLQAADTVIFLESDYNPQVDLQAMSRVHRIGQKKAVNVYRLVTNNTIEERIMAFQRIKLDMSDAIVNTDNSTVFSMGTDKLLDLFNATDDIG